jgi:hypothetical protein
VKKRLIFFPLLFSILNFLAFLRTSGAENVRAVQIVTLLATGICLGVALAGLGVRLGAKTQS